MDSLTDLNERITALRRALLELTFVVETLADMIAASPIAAARDLLTSETADDVGTQMREHLLNTREALHQANRP